MNVNHLKIATRLALGFGIVQALMAVMTAVVFMRLDYLDGRTQYLATLQQRAAMSSEWRAQAELNVSRVLAIAKSGGSSVLADYFGPQMRTTSERITELQKTMTDAVDTEQGKALVAAIAAQRNKYADVREQVLEHFARGDGAGGEALLTKDMMPAAQAYVASIEKLAGFQTRLVVEGMEEARTSVLATEALLIALLLVGLVACGGAAWLITRSITRPPHPPAQNSPSAKNTAVNSRSATTIATTHCTTVAVVALPTPAAPPLTISPFTQAMDPISSPNTADLPTPV